MTMKTHTLFGISMTALLLGGFAAGGMTVAGGRDAGKLAIETAGKARKALAKGRGVEAVTLAESAVTLAPQDVGYRLLLAQSYLKAGRFTSAHTAFAELLTLTPSDGKAALNLALAEIAEGEWDGARETLTTYAPIIPAKDRGLAWALAGDPAGGVQILMAAAREPGADARTRQNLALVLALSGQWREAKMVALTDVSESEATRRIMQWADFAKPKNASDQVAALLGVTVAEDPGRPAALALNAPAPAAEPVALAEAAPVEVAPVEAPVETAVVAEVPPAPVAPKIIFAERREVVQPLPERATRLAARGPYKTRVSMDVPAKAPSVGGWYVQLGAYDSVGVARDAWGRATRRYAALAEHVPAGAAFKGRRGNFYRLAVGGFARRDAVELCRGYRAKGGACFVRQSAGDQTAAWVKPAREIQAKAKPMRGARKVAEVAAR
jgi:Flp pilus assembly protein TadD